MRIEIFGSGGEGAARVERLDTAAHRITGATCQGRTEYARDRWATTGGCECNPGHRFGNNFDIDSEELHTKIQRASPGRQLAVSFRGSSRGRTAFGEGRAVEQQTIQLLLM